jgi:predicted membrane channel-forming protein YqfA (hemolysin III family)
MTEPTSSPQSNKILRATIWVAIGALIAAALVCVVWVLIGDSNGIVGKAFLTILLLAGFAGVAIAESNMAQNRPTWLALTSMISWVLILLVGRSSSGCRPAATSASVPSGVQVHRHRAHHPGALLHARLFLKAFQRHQTTFTSIVTYVTIGLVVILMVMLVLPLMTDEFVTYRPLYWRVVVALAILSAVGTALLPLVNALFAPKRPRPRLRRPLRCGSTARLLTVRPHSPWRRPLPPLSRPRRHRHPPGGIRTVAHLRRRRHAAAGVPDGSPDWNAYYTGQPSSGARFWFTEGASTPTAPPRRGTTATRPPRRCRRTAERQSSAPAPPSRRCARRCR